MPQLAGCQHLDVHFKKFGCETSWLLEIRPSKSEHLVNEVSKSLCTRLHKTDLPLGTFDFKNPERHAKRDFLIYPKCRIPILNCPVDLNMHPLSIFFRDPSLQVEEGALYTFAQSSPFEAPLLKSSEGHVT